MVYKSLVIVHESIAQLDVCFTESDCIYVCFTALDCIYVCFTESDCIYVYFTASQKDKKLSNFQFKKAVEIADGNNGSIREHILRLYISTFSQNSFNILPNNVKNLNPDDYLIYHARQKMLDLIYGQYGDAEAQTEAKHKVRQLLNNDCRTFRDEFTKKLQKILSNVQHELDQTYKKRQLQHKCLKEFEIQECILSNITTIINTHHRCKRLDLAKCITDSDIKTHEIRGYFVYILQNYWASYVQKYTGHPIKQESDDSNTNEMDNNTDNFSSRLDSNMNEMEEDINMNEIDNNTDNFSSRLDSNMNEMEEDINMNEIDNFSSTLDSNMKDIMVHNKNDNNINNFSSRLDSNMKDIMELNQINSISYNNINKMNEITTPDDYNNMNEITTPDDYNMNEEELQMLQLTANFQTDFAAPEELKILQLTANLQTDDETGTDDDLCIDQEEIDPNNDACESDDYCGDGFVPFDTEINAEN